MGATPPVSARLVPTLIGSAAFAASDSSSAPATRNAASPMTFPQTHKLRMLCTPPKAPVVAALLYFQALLHPRRTLLIIGLAGSVTLFTSRETLPCACRGTPRRPRGNRRIGAAGCS